MKIDVKSELSRMAEKEYAAFSAKLLPPTAPVLGVRLPKLRALAARIVQDDAAGYLQTAKDDTFEEIMLQGMVIGLNPVSTEQKLLQISSFLPKIDNWSVCDSFCCGLKFTRSAQEQVLSFLLPLLCDPHPYTVRFALVMLLDYYIGDAHLFDVLSLAGGIESKDDCVISAAGWALSMCCAAYPEETVRFLEKFPPQKNVFHCTVRKCCESRQIPSEIKLSLHRMEDAQNRSKSRR